jgi:hypothetical protein
MRRDERHREKKRGCEKMMRDREKGGCYFRFRVRKNILFILAFFLSASLVESVRLVSVLAVQSVLDFENRNEPELL